MPDLREIFGFRDSGEHGTFPEIIQISRLNDSEKNTATRPIRI